MTEITLRDYLDQQDAIKIVDGHPAVTLAELLTTVALNAQVRAQTRAENTPLEGALRALTFSCDEMLAAVLAPLDADDDAALVAAWRRARRDVDTLLAAP